MRILYLSSYYKPAFVYGGPTRSVAAHCEGLARLGAAVTVLTTNANGGSALEVPLGQKMDVDGVSVFYYPLAAGVPESWYYSPGLTRAFAEMVPGYDLAVLETFFSLPTGPAVAACLRSNTPFIIPPRGQLLPWALRQKRVKKQVYLWLVGRRQLNRAVGLQCSDPMELKFVNELRLTAPSFIVPNSLDAPAWEQLPPRGALRRKLGIPENDVVLLMLGRLHRVKNPELALEMLGSLARPDMHLVFAGPDEENYQPRLRARATALGCAQRVHFTGLLKGESLREVMADADLLLMPSSSENFGMAAAEAMAAGLPLLVSEAVPVGHWAEAAGAGRVAACTAEAFRHGVYEMLASPGQLKEMGKRGQALVRDRFEISKVARLMLTQYEAIVTSGRPLPDV